MIQDQGMKQSADELVTEFCAMWSDPDPERILSYFTEDSVYQNIPMPPARGRCAIEEFLGLVLDGLAGIDFTVHRQFSQGDVVMNERTDVMRRNDGGHLNCP
jgi:limonene-1,2-epoxide hydrolase